MNNKYIYLHIGIPKTGTTAVQYFLKKNNQALLKQGVLIPKSVLTPNNEILTLYATKKTTNKLISRSKTWTKESVSNFPQKLNKEIAKHYNKINKIILTNEGLSVSVTKKNEFEALKEIINIKDFQIKIILYLRRQDEYILSAYSTNVRRGRTSEFDISNPINVLNYDKFLSNWESEFGFENIIVKVYDKLEFPNQNILYDFADTIGLNIKKLQFINKPINKSLDIEKLEFLRLFNKHCPFYIENGTKPNKNRFNIIQILESISTSKKLNCSLSERKNILKQYAKSNEIVAKKYLNKNFLFNKFDLKYYEENENRKVGDLSKDDLMKIFAEIWIYANKN